MDRGVENCPTSKVFRGLSVETLSILCLLIEALERDIYFSSPDDAYFDPDECLWRLRVILSDDSAKIECENVNDNHSVERAVVTLYDDEPLYFFTIEDSEQGITRISIDITDPYFPSFVYDTCREAFWGCRTEDEDEVDLQELLDSIGNTDD